MPLGTTTIRINSVKFDSEADGEFFDLEDLENAWKNKTLAANIFADGFLQDRKTAIIEYLLTHISDETGWMVMDMDYDVIEDVVDNDGN